MKLKNDQTYIGRSKWLDSNQGLVIELFEWLQGKELSVNEAIELLNYERNQILMASRREKL